MEKNRRRILQIDCFVIRENSIEKRKSCFVRRSSRRVERKTTRSLDKPVLADRSSVHLFSLCLCVYSFLLQNSNLWYWYVCTIYPRTIESNPGFLQNCNFLRFHAISREAISIGELHANGRNVRIKMRRVILFRECLLLSSSSFSFFYIR